MYCASYHRQNFSLLLDFTCATAKDELEKHAEMRTIAMVELQNNFPSEFSREVLKCLPSDVAKINLNPHTHVYKKNKVRIPKPSMVIYIADKVEWNDTFLRLKSFPKVNFPIVSHLSKHLIVSSDEKKNNKSQEVFTKLPNVVQIYKEKQKVISRSFDMTRNLPNFKTYESSQRENISQILFPDKTKNLNGKLLHAVWMNEFNAQRIKGSEVINNKWSPFLAIVQYKLNATFAFTQISKIGESFDANYESRVDEIFRLSQQQKLDFYLNFEGIKFELESYNSENWCFIAPVPEPYSITELILFLPMDKSCWMWLGITIAVSTLIWRISESHWHFPFGFFAFFMGQAQLIIRIRTNRLTMKILLQLLIFGIFIFSNGYQSLVTSFMLEPEKQPFLKSVDELLESDLNIELSWTFAVIHRENPKYQRAERNGRFIEEDFQSLSLGIAALVDKRFARIQPCELFKNKIEFDGDGKSWKKVYLIPEVAFSEPQQLFVRPFHPYLDKFQELMDRSFKAGLHQAWEKLFWENWRQAYFHKKEKPDEEKEFLDFELIRPFFLILVFGFGAALLALSSEIFWKDFVTQLSKKYFKRKWKEIFGRRRRRLDRVLVRKIQVRSAPARRNSI